MNPLIQFFSSLSRTLDCLTERLGQLVSGLSLLMVLVTFVIVILRYAFGLGWIAMQESVVIMHGMLFMLGIAYTLKHDAHVRVDVLYQNWTLKKRAWVNLLGTLFFLLPLSVFLFYICWPYVADAWEIKESSAEAGGLEGIYLVKTLLLIMPVTLFLQGLALSIRQLVIIISPTPTTEAL